MFVGTPKPATTNVWGWSRDVPDKIGAGTISTARPAYTSLTRTEKQSDSVSEARSHSVAPEDRRGRVDFDTVT